MLNPFLFKKPMGKLVHINLKVVWVVSILLSLVVRLPGLYGASYSWRVHQTELTAYWFGKEGIDLLHYQTPIYGPPWQIPFEFPLFQATAALIYKAGFGDIGFASRLTALLCFYLNALILYLLCRKIFQNEATNFVIISLFLWLPYNIYYSTLSLIDYLALTLALAYLYFILCWIKSPRKAFYASLAALSGTLAILVKPTTTPIVIVPIIALVIKDILAVHGKNFSKPINMRSVLDSVIVQSGYWLALLAMVLIPLIMGSLWTRHADKVKNISIFTQWLTSEALQPWNFGSWALRSDPLAWINRAQDGQRWLMPYGMQIFVILGLFAAVGILKNVEPSEDINIFITSVGASILLTYVIFLNLYLHLYYFIAWSASIPVLAGYGIVTFWRLASTNLKCVFVVWILVFIAGNTKDYQFFRTMIDQDVKKSKVTSTWAHEVQRFVPEDKWVIVVDSDWIPTVPYFLERKAMVFSPKDRGKPICKLAKEKNFSLVVLADPGYQANLTRVLRCFKSSQEVMPGVFQTQH